MIDRAAMLVVVLLASYVAIGTSGNVDDIKRVAPTEMVKRGWQIVRYEGFKYGSLDKHGGSVWYHVKDLNHANTYYRVNVAMWGGELQYYYGGPEALSRINIDNQKQQGK